VNVPILTPLVMHGLAREPYLRGRYRLGDVQLYVSRGVGNSGTRVRVNAPPEVTLLTLRAARSPPPRVPSFPDGGVRESRRSTARHVFGPVVSSP
jgi:uncharacterized protein (DUF58 family)